MALAMGEGLVRLATMNQENYVIEMWRYAKLLKMKSPRSDIGHQHIPNRTATLQNVVIRINSLGMRGPEPNDAAPHRIAIIGDSIALGWGVDETQTLRGQLSRTLSPEYDVVNAGIGNMNMSQSVALWEQLSKKIKADTLVVLVTPRATTQVTTQSPGWLVENSELAALATTFIQQALSGEYGKDALVAGYHKQWHSLPGKAVLTHAFDKLKLIKDETGCKIIIVSIPEMHDLIQYRFGFMEEITHDLSQKYGFDFIDPLPQLKDHPTTYYWASANDIHPNEVAFRVISGLVSRELQEE
ncbi:hypothetical protein ABHF91_00565 [Pseudaeromonas sp. ZJS20]|uniref:SGNH/GDSL hydrolase family protein n=1 Tax=Pseudaeromonas aegiceratis TaxID=3153928 RepID=UPI00390C93A9